MENLTEIKKTYKAANLLPLLLIDAGAILFSGALAFYLRFSLYFFAFSANSDQDPIPYLKLTLVIIPIWLIIHAFYGLYNEKYIYVGAEEYYRLVHSATLGAVGLMILSFFLKKEFARGWVILVWIVATILLIGVRYAYRHLKYSQRRKGIDVRNAVIIGVNTEADFLYEKIKTSPHLGLSVLGFIDGQSDKSNLLGTLNDLETIVSKNNVEATILVASALSSNEIQLACSRLNNLGVEAYLSPSLLNIMSSRIAVQPIAGIPLISIQPVILSGLRFAAKRILDLIGSLIVSVILLPILVLIALLIKLESKGPILFKQERIGRKSRPFMMYKFRTMGNNAEKQLKDILHLNEAEGHIFKMKNDPRLTRLGRFLRKYSLDEFPQLINVFKGEMSLVGPRPPIPGEVENYSQFDLQRLGTLPGMTGLWQISGRSELPFEEMVKLDIYYIENWSPLFDLYILFRTIPVVLWSKGAY